jgi:quercetin 2,3-dioxygenase
MRSIRKIHEAAYEPIADLETFRAIPTRSVQYLDPFLFLNHHGPQTYAPNNRGLPFGPHPHRGFETVTFVLDGDIAHRDSGGNQGVIYPGGIQWMTAGSGLIHSEVSSEGFKEAGGKLEVLQLWINLPARLKMTEPSYRDLQKSDIPVFRSPDLTYCVNVMAGEWEGVKGPHDPGYDVSLFTIEMEENAKLTLDIPAGKTVFFYIVRGNLIVNGRTVPDFHLVEFEYEEGSIELIANQASYVLLGYADPFGEPVVSQGPFVMNTRQEIEQAYLDYQAGKFGVFR